MWIPAQSLSDFFNVDPWLKYSRKIPWAPDGQH